MATEGGARKGMTRAQRVEAGKKGGEAVRDKLGREHYSKIGRKGAAETRRRYGLAHFSRIGGVRRPKAPAQPEDPAQTSMAVSFRVIGEDEWRKMGESH